MSGARCLIVQPVHDHGLDLLRRAGVEPVICPDPSVETVTRLLPGCVAAITRDAGFSAACFAAAEGLRIVIVHGAGHDAVDKAAASRTGVLVCNSPGFNARSVSELALAAARLIPDADWNERASRHGFRERHTLSELSGKTALIVGWRATGAGCGRMLKAALSMRILVSTPRANPGPDGERVATLADGLRKADFVSLHAPMRKEARGLIGEAALAKVKPGAILVNTARAGLVDEAALAHADGRIAAAGRVIFTPHLGGAIVEALKQTAVGSANNVLTALSGGGHDAAAFAAAGWDATMMFLRNWDGSHNPKEGMDEADLALAVRALAAAFGDSQRAR